MVSRADATAAGNTAQGILLVAVGVFSLTINDAMVKHLGETYPIAQVVFFRMLCALPFVLALALYMGGPRVLRIRRPVFHFGRGLIFTVAAFTFYLSLTLLPLAETTAIAFSGPLFVALLSLPLLGERPTPRQWLATIAGFIGVMLIVRPGSATFTLAALVPLVTALGYALFMMSARFLRSDENLWATMAYATAVPLICSALLLPWFWQPPEPAHWPFFIGSGIFGGLGISLITQGFRVGVASAVAPFEYTGMIWAACFGWFFWHEVPSALTITGGVVIAATGVFLAWEHQRASRQRRLPETLPPP